MSREYLVEPKPAPALNIPKSSSTVDVRIIDSTSAIDGDINIFLIPHIAGHDRLDCPAYSFLISHTDAATKKTSHTLFDLGVRKDWWNLAPPLGEKLKGPDSPFTVSVEHNVAEILDMDKSGLGVKSTDIDAVIYSHHHWDHTGDLNTFPDTTKLIVGPGFKAAHLPGYPLRDDSPLLQKDIEKREVREIDIASEGKGLTLGRCPAYDYFGDGSFYLLDTPGHAVGHVCGLARVTESSFIMMGGDACHHGGEFRPTEYLPLPKSIAPWPAKGAAYLRHGACPGELLQSINPHQPGATMPFYEVKEGFSADHDVAEETIGKLGDFDAAEEVFIVLAHDSTLKEHLKLFPEKFNGWKETGIKEETRWLFTGVFEEAVTTAAAAAKK